jgi:hypothetical protein
MHASNEVIGNGHQLEVPFFEDLTYVVLDDEVGTNAFDID